MDSEITIFIVNLKKDKDKRKHMEQLCSNYNLNCIFIDAVLGINVEKEEIDKCVDNEKTKKYMGRVLSYGEIGCSLSHRKIYKKIINENISQALILEDDIEFNEDLIFILKKISLFPKNWEVILLGHHTHFSRIVDTRYNLWSKKINIYKNYFVLRPSELGYGTYGYVVNTVGAKKLLNQTERIMKPIDHYTGDDSINNLYIINPSIIKINDYMSENMHSMEDRKEITNKLLNKNLKYYIKSFLIFIGIRNLRDFLKRLILLRIYN